MRSQLHHTSKHPRLLKHTRCQGFGLILIASLFTAFSVVATVAIDRNVSTAQIKNQQTQQQKLSRLQGALIKYAQYKGRLPCPASPYIAVNDTNFGTEVNGGVCDVSVYGSNIPNVTSPALPGVDILRFYPSPTVCASLGKQKNCDISSQAVRGMVPIALLMSMDGSITPDDAFDDQNNRIMYVVDSHLTFADPNKNYSVSGIHVQDTVNKGEAWVDFILISYGRDKLGGIPRTSTSVQIGCNSQGNRGTGTNTTHSTTVENCNDDIFFIKRPQNTSDQAAVTNYIDWGFLRGYYDDDILLGKFTCSNGMIPRRSDGQCTNAYCWGDNKFGQLGNGPTGTTPPAPAASSVPVPVVLPGGAGAAPVYAFQSISAYSAPDGSSATVCAIAATSLGSGSVAPYGDLYCWGKRLGYTGPAPNYYKVPTKVAIPVGAPSNFKYTYVQVGEGTACAMGGDPTAATFPNGNIYCWGDNALGALGNEGPLTTKTETPRAVTSPGFTFRSPLMTGNILSGDGKHWCAIGRFGTNYNVYCWGDDSKRLLGTKVALGQSITPVVADAVSTAITASSPVDLPASIGGHGSMVYTKAGQLIAWGGGVASPNILAPNIANSNESTRDRVFAGGSDEVVCFTAADGKLKCQGKNFSGQFGDGSTNDSATPIDAAGRLNMSGYSLGLTNYDATTHNINATACALASTSGSTYALNCWGDNGSGQLGNGVSLVTVPPPISIPARVLLPKGVSQFIPAPAVPITSYIGMPSTLSVGGNTVCALTSLR